MASRTVAVIGSGIVGLAHAWSAARRGHRVLLFERHRSPQGASARNFGIILPVAQPPGTLLQAALRSRNLWLLAAKQAQFHCHDSGSLYLAYRDDEMEVLTHHTEKGRAYGYSTTLLTPAQILKKSPIVQPNGLQGGMWSSTELGIDPRQALAALKQWLIDKYNIEPWFNRTIAAIQLPTITATTNQQWQVDRAVVCTGADFETLYPDIFQSSGMFRCKLQMLKTIPQPGFNKPGPHIAGGLSLRHYASFSICPSLPKLRARVAEEAPELDRYGIHVLAAQSPQGEIILGDSHEHEDYIEPFDKVEIDNLILREAKRLLNLPTWDLSSRWHGIYAKHPDKAQFLYEPEPGVKIVNATGGAGMTLAFGLAESLWENW